MSTASPASSPSAPTGNRGASRWRRRPILPASSRPRARWRSTASRSPSTRSTQNRFGINIIPHTLTHTTWGAKKPGDRVNLEVDVFARYVVRAMELRSVMDGLKTATYAEGKGFLSPIDEIIEDLRNGRMIILVDAEDRENEGDLVIPAQMATPDAINFMAKHGRGLICLSLTRPARRPAAARVHGAPERGAQPHGLHGVHRGARGHRHRHLRARPRAHHRHRHRPHQGLQRHRLARPRLPADRARGRRAGAGRAYRGQRRSRPARRPLPRRRHLRDHERRRHHGAHARPRRLRPAPRPQDRHHRGPDRLPPAPRPASSRRWRRRRSTARTAATSICTCSRPRSSRSSTWPSSRATLARRARCWCACMPSTC